jgi:hypothetical protein
MSVVVSVDTKKASNATAVAAKTAAASPSPGP